LGQNAWQYLRGGCPDFEYEIIIEVVDACLDSNDCDEIQEPGISKIPDPDPEVDPGIPVAVCYEGYRGRYTCDTGEFDIILSETFCAAPGSGTGGWEYLGYDQGQRTCDYNFIYESTINCCSEGPGSVGIVKPGCGECPGGTDLPSDPTGCPCD
jgi:hypothetical protein